MTTFRKFRMQGLGKKLYIGHEQREGWSGRLPFYLFFCGECEHFAKDYPHGFIERQYLICSFCGVRHSFVPWWVPLAQAWAAVKIGIKYRMGRF